MTVCNEWWQYMCKMYIMYNTWKDACIVNLTEPKPKTYGTNTCILQVLLATNWYLSRYVTYNSVNNFGEGTL